MSALLLLALTTAHAADPGTANFTAKGFQIADASGKNTVYLGGSFQPRYTLALNGDPDAADADAMGDSGFRVRRALFLVNGTIAGNLDFRFRIDAAKTYTFTDADGKTQQATKPVLDDAQVVYRIAEPFQISVGQYKVQFTSEQMQSDTSLLMPDRSILIDGYKYGDVKVSGYGWSRDVGANVQGTVADKKFEYQVGVFNGDGSNAWPTTDDGMLYSARVAVNPLGEFKYDEVDLDRGKPKLAVGLDFSMNNHPSFDDNGDKSDTATDMRYGGELRFMAAGLSVNGELLLGSVSAGDGSDPATSMGFYAQAGYMTPIGIAPGVRYSQVDPDSSSDGKDDAVSQIEGVVNYYLPDPAKKGGNLGHKAQLQAAWQTTLLQGTDHPVANSLILAANLGF